MDSFNAGSITTDWKLNLSGYKVALVNAEKLALKTGTSIGTNLNTGVSKNVKANSLGKSISSEILEGIDPGTLGTKSATSFRSKFRSGLKGLFKGANIGTVFSGVGLGLNIATLAYDAITRSAQKAREEQERYRAEIEVFNNAVANNDNYIKESNRLKQIAANNALSASEKFFQMTQSAEQLDQALQDLIKKEKDNLLKDISGPLNNLIVARDKLRKENEGLDRILDPKNRPIVDKSPLLFQNDKRRKNQIKIDGLNEKIAPKQAEVDRINDAASAYGLLSKAARDFQLKLIDLNQQKSNALVGGSQSEVDAIDDAIFEIKLKQQIGKIDAANSTKLVAGYLAERREARAAGRERQVQLQAEAKSNAKALIAEEKLNAIRAEARQLLESSRTPLEQYVARLEQLAEFESNNKLTDADTGGSETFERQRIAALVALARTTGDAKLVFEQFEKQKSAGLITSAKQVDVQNKLNDALGITADRKKAEAELEKQLLFVTERMTDRKIILARLANDDSRVQKLERELELQERIAKLVDRGGVDPDKAADQANREINEEDVAAARGVFRSGFSDGLRAAIEGDLGSFLEQKLQDLAANMFDRAVENLADAVFDQLAQIAPGFLGQITGNSNLPNALTGATGAAGNAATSIATQATGAGTQAAGATATATAVTTAMTAGGTTAATAIGTAMTTSGTAVAGQIAAAMASGGAGSGLSSFAGAFESGGVIGRGQFGLVGENGPELVSAGSAPLRITPFDNRLRGFSSSGLESRGSNQSPPSNVVMNISGIKDLGSFVKSQGTIEADMASALRRAQSDF